MKQSKILSPKIDVVFQALFGEVGSENITKKFLQTILNEKIDDIDLSKNPILRKNFNTDKLGVLDIVATINGKDKCNIEMQVRNQNFIIDRILYYWSKLFSKQLQNGDNYDKLEKTITILIADFELNSLKELDFLTRWKIIETNHSNIILTDKLEIVILELPKIRKLKETDNELLDWLLFIDNPNSRRIMEKMKKNKELKEANQKLQTMSDDEYMQRLADLREKAILDERSNLYAAKKEGFEQGQIEIAKKMLKKGIDIDTIIEITNLSKDEILNNK